MEAADVFSDLFLHDFGLLKLGSEVADGDTGTGDEDGGTADGDDGGFAALAGHEGAAETGVAKLVGGTGLGGGLVGRDGDVYFRGVDAKVDVVFVAILDVFGGGDDGGETDEDKLGDDRLLVFCDGAIEDGGGDDVDVADDGVETGHAYLAARWGVEGSDGLGNGGGPGMDDIGDETMVCVFKGGRGRVVGGDRKGAKRVGDIIVVFNGSGDWHDRSVFI